MCEFMDIVTDDFSTYMTEESSKGLNACFNDTSLMEAFNMTAQLNFTGPLKAGFATIPEQKANLVSAFLDIKNPLVDLSATIDTELTTSLATLNSDAATAKSSAADGFNSLLKSCPIFSAGNFYSYHDGSSGTTGPGKAFCDSTTLGANADIPTYTPDNILTPWTVTTHTDRISCINGESFNRQSSETAVQYYARVYGTVDAFISPPSTNCQNANCGWASDCDTLLTTTWDSSVATLVTDVETNFGDLEDGITLLENTRFEMMSDLGADEIFCSINPCPTVSFGASSIYAAISDYEDDLSGLMDDIIALSDDLISGLIYHIEDFGCNMRCKFLADVSHNSITIIATSNYTNNFVFKTQYIHLFLLLLFLILYIHIYPFLVPLLVLRRAEVKLVR